MSRKSICTSNSRPAFGTPKQNKRQSLSILDNSDTTTRIYEAIINDPARRAEFLELFSKEKHLIYDYLRQEGKKTPVKHMKKVYCESPTALFRRKMLGKMRVEQKTDDSASSSDKSEETFVSPPVPYNKLLEGVIAFVEVKTKSGDRSSATKAVVASMGATVRQQLTKDVTHVIFKDGSFETYQKANLIKAHVVSLLWIEAIRKNRVRVPEKNYPALGTEAFNANLSLLCQQMQEEYEEAVQDELNQTLTSAKGLTQNQRKTRRMTMLPSISGINSTVQRLELRRQTLQSLASETPSVVSSDSSDCGMIDGETSRKIMQTLDLSIPESSFEETTVMKSIENIENHNNELNNNSNKTTNTSSNHNSTGDTSNGSTSLLNLKGLQSVAETNTKTGKNKENRSIDMELTGNVGGMLQVTTAKKLLRKVSEEVLRRKKGSSKQRLFADDSVTSGSNSDRMEPLTCNQCSGTSSLKLSTCSDESSSNKQLNHQITSSKNLRRSTSQNENTKTSSTMSSLRLSSETSNSVQNSISNEFVTTRKKRQLNGITSQSSPEKIKKQESENTTKIIRKRKLYNPDAKLSGSCFKEKEDSTIVTKPTTIIKKTTIPLPPILLTTRAKRFVDDMKTKTASKNCTVKSQVTPPRKLNPPRAIKSTVKKATANKTEENLQKARSSSFYFDDKPIKTPRKKIKKKTSIVCTRLHKPDVEVFQQIVKKLGGFFVEDEVSSSTTHLVAGEVKRTINLLKALAKGCWVLKHEWLLKSLEAGKWLPEEEYELTEFSTAVQRCRIQRQAFGPTYSIDIFKDCGFIYVAKSSIPRCSDLQELVKLCKGKVTVVAKKAKIVVGEVISGNEVMCVRETWILDSIAENKLKPLKNYLLESSF